jgi:hypothetical protein
LYFGPGWWGPYPYYPYLPYYPYYPSPLVINQPPVEIYAQEEPGADESSYLYFCPEPQGYYPQVEKCPKGWLKVAP